MAQMTRGQKAKLADLGAGMQLRAGLGASGAGLKFDISCFGVDQNGQLSDDRYFVFFNQTASPEGALKLAGASASDAQSFDIDLARLPNTIRKLVFAITIDGAGEMKQLASGHFRLLAGGANGTEVARFEFSGADFAGEKAIIAAEVYFKDAWRVAAVGQGFSGGLSALLKHFGGQEAEETPAIAPPIVSPAALPTMPMSVPSRPEFSTPQNQNRPTQAENPFGGPPFGAPPIQNSAPASTSFAAPVSTSAPSVNLRKVELEKKMERQAPHLVSLAKQAQVSLEKKGLGQHAARVALCLDISASMSALYHAGKIQRLAEKVLALGTRFDDDGAIDIFLFGASAHDVGPMSIDNFANFIGQMLRTYPLEGGTMYGRAMQAIRRHYFPNSGGALSSPQPDRQPVYVMFLTDGQTGDPGPTRQQLQWAAYEPIFWQFMGIGKSRKDVASGGGGFWARAFASDFAFLEEMDTMTGRYVDNANFFSISDPESLPDAQLYDLLMSEYPDWVRAAPGKGLLH